MSSLRTRSPMVIIQSTIDKHLSINQCRYRAQHKARICAWENMRNGKKDKDNFIIMSFGEQEYQHRFFKPNAGKGKVKQTYLPPIPYHPYGEYNDYLYNSLLIDSFKRDADYHRFRKRVHSLAPYSYPYTYPYYYDAPRRLATEPIVQPLPPLAPSVVYLNKQTPDVLPSMINYTAMASRVREAEREAERAQTEAAQEREHLREYRHKYQRLKTRLRDQIGERRIKQAQLRQRRQAELEQQKEKIEKIGEAVLQMSQQVSNNSRIMEQNLKLREELGDLTQDRVLVFPSVPTVLSRSVVIDKPKLDSQYREMRRLKKQIGELDKKLGYSTNPA